MPIGPAKTKAQKQKVMHTEMSKFKGGTLHSRSKSGPVVKSRAQAVAIGLSESGQSKPKGYDRSAHHKGNPGFNRTETIHSPPLHRDDSKGATHVKQQKKGSGYVRSSHMKANVGPEKGGGGGAGQKPHTNLLSTAEPKDHGSGSKLPGEKHIAFRKGIEAGDSFEQEIKEHFPGKGVAGMHKTAMPQKDSPVTAMSTKHSDSHGHVSGKAEHMPHVGPAYNFPCPPMRNASGFGHADHQRQGPLRTSGHKGGHQIGKR